MSSLAELPELVGFFSYSRRDDELSDKALSLLRKRIGNQLGLLLGRDVRLWQDTEAIPHGALWEAKIRAAIAESAFFIPIITPSAVKSSYCKTEFEAFLDRESELLRDDLVFPILYVRVPALANEDQRSRDNVLKIIHVRQYADWTKIRLDDVASAEVGKQIARFCEDIVEALHKPWESPEERHRREEAEALRRAEEERRRKEEAEALRRAEEDRRRKEEAEALRRAEDDRRRKEEVEARQKAEEERLRKEEAEVRRRAEEERQRGEETEAKRRAEEERQRGEETEAKRRAEEQRGAEAARCRAEGQVQIRIGDGRSDEIRWLLPGGGRTQWFKDHPLGPEMVVVPAGEFLMGSRKGDGESDEHPQHKVTFARPFAVGRFAVTFDEWDAAVALKGVIYAPDTGWGRRRRPVINVSWEDARAYVTWLSRETSKSYRLLSEAEWEYCCRAGTTTKYSFGDTIDKKQARFGWNSWKALEVGSFPANAWGLHDMHGNVEEWCEDNWHPTYLGAPEDGSVWKGDDASLRIVRGGSYVNPFQTSLRSARRYRRRPDSRATEVGFRVARTL